MSAVPDLPIPAFLAMPAEPLTDEDLDRYYDAAEHLAGEATMDVPDALRWLAETHEGHEPVHAAARWSIEAQDEAEWAMRKLAAAQAEVAQLSEQAEEWMERISAWFVQAARRPERTVAYMTERLEDYGQRVRAGGGPKTITLPSGVVKTTERKPAAEVTDEAALDEYFRQVTQLADDDANESPWFTALEGAGLEPHEVVAHPPKVSLSSLRQIVRVGAVENGFDVTVLLACGHHTPTWHVEAIDDPTVPARGTEWRCVTCEQATTVEVTTMESVWRPAVLGPDGVEVPGTQVRGGSIGVKVEAR